MSRSSYSYDDEDDYDIRFQKRGPSPGGVRYVANPQRAPNYYDAPPRPSYIGADRLNISTIHRSQSRSRSREHSRTRERRASSPPAPVPVIINNRIYNDISSDDEDSRHKQVAKSSRHRRSRSRSSSSRSRSSSYMTREEWEAERTRKELEDLRLATAREKDERKMIKQYRDEWEAEQARKDLERNRLASSRERDERQREKDERQLVKGYREEWEAEQSRKELEKLHLSHTRDEEERRRLREFREEEELKQAKRELEKIKGRKARADEEDRIKKEIELKRLREEDTMADERRRREKEANSAVEEYKRKELERVTKEKKLKDQKEKEAAEAVERYKQAEKDRIAKEKAEKEAKDKEYQERLREDLVKSGLDDKAIEAILKKEKIKRAPAVPQPQPRPLQHHAMPGPSHQFAPVNQLVNIPPPQAGQVARPTYTRMARRHLSIESLREFGVEFDFDSDPDYLLIRRWVPEWEQDRLWKHTKLIRESRSKMLMVEEKRHGKEEPDFEWVRKKSDKHSRRRSKSPSLLMYLAGARPA
ncbi:hypothetical protein BKA59DRAFT_111591 [Fusarium tricinctum]|uniref:DUF8035 domain-containing protein n=2 Tax=Fusarium tricinctum species complex TaxID=679429 RepID=A0A8K0WGK5_9HYPO|nr:hypothetical protein BKA59DRAFT_111591 [Fusarium tricinctum]